MCLIATSHVDRHRNKRTSSENFSQITYLLLLPVCVAFLKLFGALLTISVHDDATDWGLRSVSATETCLGVGLGRGNHGWPACVLGHQIHVVIGTMSAVSRGVGGALAEHGLVKTSKVLDIRRCLASSCRIVNTVLVLVDNYARKKCQDR